MTWPWDEVLYALENNKIARETTSPPPGSEWIPRLLGWRPLWAVRATYSNPAILLFLTVSGWYKEGVPLNNVIPPAT